MDLHFTVEPHDMLVVHLRDGDRETTLAVTPSSAGRASLRRAFDDALATGYGECFWPSPTGGQYWWIFKRTDDSIETMTMWTRGGASLWEHVFRATDSVTWLRDRLEQADF